MWSLPVAERKSSLQPTPPPLESVVQFTPTPTQREVKARFWARAAENPLIDPASLPAARIGSIAGTSSVARWFAEPGCEAWFRNRDAARHQIEAGVEVAVSRLIEILQERQVGPKEAVTSATQVSAAKLLLEYAGYAPPSRREVTFQDKTIQGMDEAQLRAYIAANLPALPGIEET